MIAVNDGYVDKSIDAIIAGVRTVMPWKSHPLPTAERGTKAI